MNSEIEKSNNSTFVISIFEVSNFRNIGRSKFWPASVLILCYLSFQIRSILMILDWCSSWCGLLTAGKTLKVLKLGSSVSTTYIHGGYWTETWAQRVFSSVRERESTWSFYSDMQYKWTRHFLSTYVTCCSYHGRYK